MFMFVGTAFFVVFVIVYGAWTQHDKAERRRKGLPRRNYGVGIFNADVTSHTYTHKVGNSYYSTTYTYPDDDDE